eukprot:TRINITY_DN7612_c0_g1_i1.p1 TRINITY_DN7612_c0_g1~~TRINITY_DN7612_c0_g1_i1.p1  ORF type:complete len:563 (-),score=153.80 TRINITY_DN7612_c0_g1_i1:26-1714(-)
MYRLKVVITEEINNIPTPYIGKVIYQTQQTKNNLMDNNDLSNSKEKVKMIDDKEKIENIVTINKEIKDNETNNTSNSLKLSSSDSNLNNMMISFSSGNPTIEIINGILHLYKDKNSEITNYSLPEKRSDIICCYAVPSKIGTDEFIKFIGAFTKIINVMRVVRDKSPKYYNIVFKFQNQEDSDEFYKEYNGKPYNSVEPEVCRLFHISDIQFILPNEDAFLFPPPNQVELPTCPVCLEILERSVSGVFITLCNHSFHCDCLVNWKSTENACPVCRYTLPQSNIEAFCSDCQEIESLWMCLLCGYIGCGRYVMGHAHKHFASTGHTYALELETQRVWDYTGDGYVHRLIQNKSDGKIVELPPLRQVSDFREPHSRENDSSHQPEKINSIVVEYNFLLTSQLQVQRQYYEDQIESLKKEMLEKIKSMENKCEKHDKMKDKLNFAVNKNKDVEKLNGQMKEKLLQVMKDNQFLKELNNQLVNDQESWKKEIVKVQDEAKKKQVQSEQKLEEMNEQVRDLMFFIEAQKTIEKKGNNAQEGQVLVVPNVIKPKPKRKVKKNNNNNNN